ncbi:MAG: tRNA uridine-5-carboxymethylaminomethyl(34) synthesis GTPase MnmE [Alphaproteobacteria bacterium]|jgi:tRNA modification GTPase
MDFPDTIFALASGAPPAGIAVIRISGYQGGQVLMRLSGKPLPMPRVATRTRFMLPEAGDKDIVLDDGIAIWFPGPQSFTGEDVVELHIHGGRASVEAVAGALSGFVGVRMAEPGEFTRRAFENGKLDLTRAEALADLVSAETEAQRQQAQRQFSGALADLYDGWRQDLVAMLAHVETVVDFADEEIPKDLLEGLDNKILRLKAQITQHIDDNRQGERLRDGFEIAIIGAPNVGKSSLLNALARRDVAIVSEIAGTTRDVVELHLNLGGLPVTLADTAGIRDSLDKVEEEGIRRALVRAEGADLRLAVFDAAIWPDLDPATVALMTNETIAVFNKGDLADDDLSENAKRSDIKGPYGPVPAFVVSALTGDGFDALLDAIKNAVSRGIDVSSGSAPLTRMRHRTALVEALEALDRIETPVRADGPELLAEDLRLAARSVGRITGTVDVEDVLDLIFSEFCIGK